MSVQNQGKKRLILDLHYVNKHISLNRKFSLKTGRQLLTISEQGNFSQNLILRIGYHHLDIFPPNSRFSVFLGHLLARKFFICLRAVLPFGLSSALYIFTKLVRPLIKHWRENTGNLYNDFPR